MSMGQSPVGSKRVGATVWDAAIVMAEVMRQRYFGSEDFVAELTQRKSFTVIELGSGCGLAGISFAALLSQTLSRVGSSSSSSLSLSKCSVVLSDVASVLPVLQQNVDRNRNLYPNLTITCEPLDWTSIISKKTKTKRTFDLVIASDCVYEEEGVGPLMEAIRSVSHPKGSGVWVCYWRRGMEAERVFNRLIPQYLRVEHSWDAKENFGFGEDVHSSFIQAHTLPR